MTVDTGWVIAAERDPRRARLHIAALTRLGQVMVVSPIVIVEARQRAGDVARVDMVLARVEQESITAEDGRRASDLLREAGRRSSDAHRRVHEIRLADALVPTRGMPDWLRTVVDWNPLSAVTAACRELWGNPNPSALSSAWSMQHPVWTALAWSIAILAVCLPLAAVLCRRRTTD